MAAKVIAFPGVVIDNTIERKLCANCVHAYLGRGGVYCGEWKEEIWDEKIAEECEAYE